MVTLITEWTSPSNSHQKTTSEPVEFSLKNDTQNLYTHLYLPKMIGLFITLILPLNSYWKAGSAHIRHDLYSLKSNHITQISQRWHIWLKLAEYIQDFIAHSFCPQHMRVGVQTQGWAIIIFILIEFLWSPDPPRDSRWTGGGLEIAHLADGSSLCPPAVLAQSLPNPCGVLIIHRDSQKICGWVWDTPQVWHQLLIKNCWHIMLILQKCFMPSIQTPGTLHLSPVVGLNALSEEGHSPEAEEIYVQALTQLSFFIAHSPLAYEPPPHPSYKQRSAPLNSPVQTQKNTYAADPSMSHSRSDSIQTIQPSNQGSWSVSSHRYVLALPTHLLWFSVQGCVASCCKLPHHQFFLQVCIWPISHSLLANHNRLLLTKLKLVG